MNVAIGAVCWRCPAGVAARTRDGATSRPEVGVHEATRQQVENRRAFHRTIRWRTGREGRISTFKRGDGWDCTHLDTLQGAKT